MLSASSSTSRMMSFERQQTVVSSSLVEPCFMVDGSRLVKGCGQQILDEILEWFDDLENDIDHELACTDHYCSCTSSNNTVSPSGVDRLRRSDNTYRCAADDVDTGSLCRQCRIQTLVETTSVDENDKACRRYNGSGPGVPDDGDLADRSASQSSLRSSSDERSIQLSHRRHRCQRRRKMVTTTTSTTTTLQSCDVTRSTLHADQLSAAMSMPNGHVIRRHVVGRSLRTGNGAVIEMIDRVTLTQQVWNLGAVPRAAAIHVLQNRPDGAFVVRSAAGTDRDNARSSTAVNQVALTTSSPSDKLLHVRQGSRVVQFAIVVTSHGRWHLLDSKRTFDSLVEMIAHYCQQRSSGLNLTLPVEISAAKTLDELNDIARKQSEFWVSILSTPSATLPLRPATRPSTFQTQWSVPEQTSSKRLGQDGFGKGACDAGRRRNVEDRCADDVDTRRPRKQHRTVLREDDEDDTIGGKASDYEDLWPSASTPDRSRTPTECVVLDPTKYQLQSAVKTLPSESSVPSEAGARCAEVLGTHGKQDHINRKCADAEQSLAFDFDASSLRRRAQHIDDRGRFLDVPAKVSSSDGPSPVYAEPWDSLATGLDGHRRVLSSVVYGSHHSSAQRIAGTVEDSDEEVLSAGYRAPLDAVPAPLFPRTNSSGFPAMRRPSIPSLPPPPPIPPPPPTCDRIPEVVITAVADEISFSSSSQRGRSMKSLDSTNMVDKELSDLLDAVGCSLDNTMATRQLPGAGANEVNVPRKRVRSPDRRRDDKSDYDNMSEDDLADGDDDDDGGLMSPIPRSRLMTGSSMRTQYSPPWDGTRWQQIFAFGDDNNNEYDKMSLLWPQQSTTDANVRSLVRNLDEQRSSSSLNGVVEGTSTRTEKTSMMSTVTSSKFEMSYANSNMMYCDSSFRRNDRCVATSVANDNNRAPFLGSGIVPADSPAAHSTPVRRISAACHAGGGVVDSRECFVNGVGSLQKNNAVSDGTMGRRMQSSTRPTAVDWVAIDSAQSTYQSLSRPSRHPVSRQASGVSRATTTATSSTLTRGLPASSSVCSTMSRIGVSGWTPQKSPDVIPLIALPRLISPRYRGHRFPAAQISDFIVRLTARKPESPFGTLVQNFIQCTLNGKETNPRKVVSNIRQFMNGMKNFLSFKGEPELDKFIDSIRSEMKPSECLNLDAVLEMALIKCTVKPLKEHVYRLFEYDYTRNGNLQMLNEGLKTARSAMPQGLGLPADFVSSMDEVSKFLELMEESYSPLAKLENLLSAMTTIGGCISAHHDELMSSTTPSSQVVADDLLSTAIVVLVERNMLCAEIEVDYMWGLIHPSFLMGEARYQLTTFSSAVHQLKNFRKLAESRTSLYHRGSIDAAIVPSGGGNSDGSITIMTVDERCDTVVRHSLPVRPEVAAKDICCMLAHRLRITNPQDYGLFWVSAGLDKRLADEERIEPLLPQSSNSTFDKRKLKFVYKRLEARFVWPHNMIND